MIKVRVECLVVLLLATAVSVHAEAQGTSPSVVVTQASWSALSYQGPEIQGDRNAHRSVLRSTGWRTAIFAVGGGVLAAAITSATTDEPGFNSAEATALAAGAITGAIFSLWIWPQLFGRR